MLNVTGDVFYDTVLMNEIKDMLYKELETWLESYEDSHTFKTGLKGYPDYEITFSYSLDNND